MSFFDTASAACYDIRKYMDTIKSYPPEEQLTLIRKKLDEIEDMSKRGWYP